MRIMLFLCLLVVSINSGANEKIKIPWAVTDWAPLYIVKGVSADDGKMDRLRKVLEEKMPEYSFVPFTADSPRLIELWQMGRNACSGAMIQTPEREQWAYFSAFVHHIPDDLILFTAKPELFSEHKSYSLNKILKNPKLKGLFAQNRSYGIENDKLIQHSSPQAQVQIFPEGYKALYKMIEKKRYDYSIEYASVIRAYNEEILAQTPLSIVKLEDIEPMRVFYFSCTKNEWGRKIVRAVDQAIQHLAKSNKYRNAAESYLSPDQIKKQRALMDEFYEKRAKGPWTTAPEDSALILNVE